MPKAVILNYLLITFEKKKVSIKCPQVWGDSREAESLFGDGGGGGWGAG